VFVGNVSGIVYHFSKNDLEKEDMAAAEREASKAEREASEAAGHINGALQLQDDEANIIKIA
jgi:hypothetical protein